VHVKQTVSLLEAGEGNLRSLTIRCVVTTPRVATMLERKLTVCFTERCPESHSRTTMVEIKKAVGQKSCVKCGERFTCGAEGGEERCWCFDLPHLPLAARAGRDCLCPRCLNEAVKIALQLEYPADDLAMDSSWGRAAEPGLVKEGKRPALIENFGLPTLLLEGEDFYSDGGMIVFTASYHLRRGYCCESGCRHCPYND
jgi:Family of unknown function (DUF5522)/Cysteine-rich CWC